MPLEVPAAPLPLSRVLLLARRRFRVTALLFAFVTVTIVIPLQASSSRAQFRSPVGRSTGTHTRSGRPRAGRTPSPRATVIPNRSGGFDMYSPRGNSRYLGEAQGNKVFHPDGTSSVVIPDDTGGSTVYGPQGTHRVFPDDNE